MSIRFHCPHCNKQLKVDGELAGKTGACPGCKQQCVVPSDSEPQSARALAAPEPELSDDLVIYAGQVAKKEATAAAKVAGVAAKKTGVLTVASLKLTGRGAASVGRYLGAKLAERRAARELKLAERATALQALPQARPIPYAQPQQQPVTIVVNNINNVGGAQQRLGNGFATLAAFAGVIALAGCWIPVLGLLLVPLALAALGLAALGFLVSLFRQGAGLGMSLVGGLTGLAAIILAAGATMAVIPTVPQDASTPVAPERIATDEP